MNNSTDEIIVFFIVSVFAYQITETPRDILLKNSEIVITDTETRSDFRESRF